ncbi:MAG: ribonuclease HIII [bacterium]|nr:MAG: ribonuclease HIII [bacterium]
MTLIIAEEKFEQFKDYLAKQNYDFEERPHQYFLARKQGLVINLYLSGKIVIAGKDDNKRKDIIAFLDTLQAEQHKKNNKEYAPIEVSGIRIGTDEVGKGDYFGSLVIAGVLADEAQILKMESLGIKDSKSLSDTTVQNFAGQIKKIMGQKQYSIVVISPIKYNLLISKMKNLNRLLGWGHARAIENILIHHNKCQTAISDQFGDQSFIENALMKLGKQIQLIQTPKAEREMTVAAASILARSESINRMNEMSQSYGFEFPRGATDVIATAESFVDKFGHKALLNVAKIHFKTTGKISNISKDELKQIKVDAESDVQKSAAKFGEDTLLECFNLISTLEQNLRKFLKTKLEDYFGTNWWENGVEQKIRKKIEYRCEREKLLGRNVQLMDCLEIDDYQAIMTHPKNWDRIFKASFEDKEMVMARFKILKSVRNPVAHSRGSFSFQDRLDLISTIRYFMDKKRLG